MEAIPFNRPRLVGREHEYIDAALAGGKLSGNGVFARRCAEWLESAVGSKKALITPSCTAALEMTAILAGLDAGDEVIMPSFTFVSTANAFALRRAVPVFVDVHPRTLNVDPEAIEAAITSRTRAIVVVHYAGIACEMDRIMAIAAEHDLIVIEDAAHSLLSTYKGRPLGSIGHLATLSFHETKNVHCGEGGALLINDERFVERAEIVQEKGTDRSRFFRGEVDKYTWQDIGSSYLLSEVGTAFLAAQLECAEAITAERLGIWERYHEAFAGLEDDGLLLRPVVPAECRHSGHLYFLLMRTQAERDAAIAALAERGVHSVFHYVPLHESPAGWRFGRASGRIEVTPSVSGRLLRVPIWSGLGDARTEQVITAMLETVSELAGAVPA